jgi:hypothetical protein
MRRYEFMVRTFPPWLTLGFCFAVGGLNSVLGCFLILCSWDMSLVLQY